MRSVRFVAILAALALVLALPTVSAAQEPTPSDDPSFSAAPSYRPPAADEAWIAHEILEMINAERAARGLEALVADPVLTDLAHRWSHEMHVSGYRHSPAEFRPANFFGENILRAAPPTAFPTGALHVAWMESDGHRRSILQPGADRFGFGVFCHDGNLMATQLFGYSGGWPGYDMATPAESPIVAADTSTGTRCGDDVPPPPAPDASDADGPAVEHHETTAPDLPSVQRLGGSNRFDTAALTATVGPTGRVLLASGGDWPDAVAAGSASRDAVVLLTNRDGLPDETRDALRNGAVTELVVLGGSAAVGESAVREAELAAGIPARRIGGATRVQTAALLAAEQPPGEVVVIAHADEAMPALIGSATGAGPLLLADPTAGLDDTGLRLLTDRRPAILVLIGPAADDSALRAQVVGLADDIVPVRGADPHALSLAVPDLLGRYQSVGSLVVASATSWPDTLTAASLATRTGVPLLLVDPDGSDSPTLQAAAAERGASMLHVVGGTAALPDSALR